MPVLSLLSSSSLHEIKLNTGITNQSWTEGKSQEISQDNELSVSFNAAAKWVASVTSGADWCKLNTTSGTKGQSTLKLSVCTSSTTDRTARISINIDGYSPASFEAYRQLIILADLQGFSLCPTLIGYAGIKFIIVIVTT